jgi:hypothetical protein
VDGPLHDALVRVAPPKGTVPTCALRVRGAALTGGCAGTVAVVVVAAAAAAVGLEKRVDHLTALGFRGILRDLHRDGDDEIRARARAALDRMDGASRRSSPAYEPTSPAYIPTSPHSSPYSP